MNGMIEQICRYSWYHKLFETGILVLEYEVAGPSDEVRDETARRILGTITSNPSDWKLRCVDKVN